MTQITRNNHYVPQFYLKNWSNNGNTILTYDTVVKNKYVPIWANANIKSTAMWRDFYTVVRENTLIDWFEGEMEKYETAGKRSIARLIEHNSTAEEDLRTITGYLAAQMVRTPGWFLRTAKEFPEIFEEAVQSTARKTQAEQLAGTLGPSIQKAKEELSRPHDDPLSVPLKITPVSGEDFLCINGFMGRDTFLYLAKGTLDGTVYTALQSLPWKVLTTPPGVSLLTSDNPVVLYGKRQDGSFSLTAGIGQIHTNIFLPLSPHHLFFTEVGLSKEDLDSFQMPEKKWPNIQRAIIANATRYIYANSMFENIELLRPRSEDLDYYNELRRQQQEWNESQTAMEQEYYS